jgi:5-methyltetrahydrofolate--homocysteine methyltransferase
VALRSASALKNSLAGGLRFLADGALGSELIRQGIAPESVLGANRTHPELVLLLHRAYLEAGAQVLTTNTFGLRQRETFLDDFCSGVRLAIQAARDSASEVTVWISMTTAIASREADALAPRLLYSELWPDAVLIETCTSLSAAVEAVQEVRRTLRPNLLAVTCHFTREGTLPDGTKPEAAAIALCKAGAHCIGANCGDHPVTFLPVMERMARVVECPLIAQPNAGIPERNSEGEWVYPVLPDAFAQFLWELHEAGASISGGCCGAGPEHLRAAAQLWNDMRR